MKISNNELREKILAFLKLKGTQTTKIITDYCQTWVGVSKATETLNDLAAEGEVIRNPRGTNATNPVTWSLASDKPFTKPVVSEKVENVVHNTELLKGLPIKIRNAELEDLLAKEYRIMLKKQERRRYWAAQVLKNSENLIKLIESKIEELV